jgi:hypothetical protein
MNIHPLSSNKVKVQIVHRFLLELDFVLITLYLKFKYNFKKNYDCDNPIVHWYVLSP